MEIDVEAVKCPRASAALVRSSRPAARRAALAVLLLALLPGCAAPAPFADAAFDEEWNISSRGSRELNFEMQEGGTIRFDVNASIEVKWDLHSHSEEGTTVIHEQGAGRRWNGSFTAPADDVYSIFVAGNGSTAIVKVRVDGPFRVKA